MGNGLTLEILPYPSLPSRPWKIDIPASVAGKRTRKFFKTKTLAGEWLDGFYKRTSQEGAASALQSGVMISGAMADYSKEKLEEKDPPVGEHEKRSFKRQRKHILAEFGALTFDDLTSARVVAWLSRNRKEKNWSPRTRFNAYTYLRTFVRWANRRKITAINHIDELSEEIKKPDSPKITISVLEMKIALHCTKKDDLMRGFICFGGFEAIRTEEYFKMDWDRDCNFEDKEIHVPPEAIKDTRSRGGMKERYIKMTPAFLRHVPKDKSGPLRSVGVRQFHKRRVKLRLHMKRIIDRLNRDKVRISNPEKWNEWPDNTLRHTCLSMMMGALKNAWEVAQFAGHTNTKTLLKEYVRPTNDREAKAYMEL